MAALTRLRTSALLTRWRSSLVNRYAAQLALSAVVNEMYRPARAFSSRGSDVDESPVLPRVVGQDVVFENRWFRLKTIRFLDLSGTERKWTGLERTTTYPELSDLYAEEKCDAVVVIPFLTQKHKPTQAILIRQFRPPVGKWVIELPAGLIDDGEAPEAAATRELYEETGYMASRVLHMGSPVVNDQGLTNGRCRLVLMQVRHEEQSTAVQQKLEVDEMISVVHAPLDGLIPWLEARRTIHGDAIDARLYSYALGLQALPAMLTSGLRHTALAQFHT